MYEGGVTWGVGYGGKKGKSRRVYRNSYLEVYKYKPAAQTICSDRQTLAALFTHEKK
jgi:hypothetical protein